MSDIRQIMADKGLGKRNSVGDVWDDSWCADAAAEITRLRAALATAREKGRREGLEEAAKVVDALLPYECNTEDRSRFSKADLEKYRKGALRLAIGDIRALKGE